MKSREEEIVVQITDFCLKNRSSQFDISLEGTTGSVFLCIDENKFRLEDHRIFLYEIERLERQGKIALIKKYSLNELSDNETMRLTYSLFVPSNNENVKHYRIANRWSPLPIISLLGAIVTLIIGVFMKYNNVLAMGYGTLYGGGYWDPTLNANMVLFFSGMFFTIGIAGIPWKRKQ